MAIGRLWGMPDDGRCLCEACCWERVKEAAEADKKRKGRTPNQIAEQWENLGAGPSEVE